MRDDFFLIASQVHGLTTLDIELSKLCVRDSWREIASRNLWSWRLRRTTATLYAPYTTGSVSLLENESLVTGTGTAWTSALIGRQFRTTIDDLYYTILAVPSPTSLILDRPSSSAFTGSYSIVSAYLSPPADFFSFISVTNPARAWRLHLDVDQSLLDVYDTRRSSTGQPLLLSPLDYSTSYSGRVYPTLQAYGSGPSPVSYGSYTGPSDALFIIRIISSGSPGVATFQWHRDAAPFSSTTTTSALFNLLSDGVGITWPAGTYASGDVFVIRTSTQSNPGLPRFEIYPAPQSQTTLSLHYVTLWTDLDDPNATLPRTIPGNVVKEGALARAARIPNTLERPNLYAQIARAETHENHFFDLLSIEMQNDEEVFCRSIQSGALPLAPLPFYGIGQRPIDFDPPFIYSS